ncbi:pyridoxal phosphate-dependent aminotransferase [Serratia proteamaculans]|uniref:MalY/PatB family protein n=1 Tax=Serratia proteamaculans TaxID=28151 RepID=UPI001575C910|nr:MalY/PatB family protein [Serratia proteamaculans]NTX78613.1 pyridoxal phosphate-dependent aminotransferase [Serratia proteamaculans]NTZ27146.1 pyridoxal phosphate-dependent aminotransferase [Serratia proteamaculans]
MFDFSTPVDRHGTWCTQWDYIADRFGSDDLLPFTISDMDFATAPCILEALQQRLQHGVLGYSRWQHEDFLGAVRHWYQQRFNTPIDTQMAVYGPSVIYMVAQLIRLWSAPGEYVVTHTPAYDAFYKVILGNQRQLLACPLQKDGNDWQCDMAHLEALLARPQTKILLLCSPHNPTGKVWCAEELQQMAELCERHDVRVISDEIHMDMVWGERQHTPWSQVAATSWALLTSGSKTFNIPALTGAYGFISDDATREAYSQQLKARDGLSSPAVLAIVAHIAAYRHGEPWLDALRDYLQDNLIYVAERLHQAFPQLGWQPPQSTYLAWIDLRPLGIDDQQLQQVLIEQEKVAIMPGFTYGEEGRGFLRLNVGCPRSKVEAGMNKLISGLKSLTGER